jgi:hypothetical protein
MWVDPATYLPIRTIETAPGESVASDRAIRDDFKWLPDTAANLSLLTPTGLSPPGSPRSLTPARATRLPLGRSGAG